MNSSSLEIDNLTAHGQKDINKYTFNRLFEDKGPSGTIENNVCARQHNTRTTNHIYITKYQVAPYKVYVYEPQN